MNNSLDVIEYRGYKINVFQDEMAESPDNWGNDDCFLIYDHRQFSVQRKGFDPDEVNEFWVRTKGARLYDGYRIYPVFAYIHSGVSLSLGRNTYPFTCPWDTSMKGFVLVKRQKGWTYTERASRKVAQSVINEWNDYLSGNVYGYTIDGLDDSCWGFYGDYRKESQMISEAKGAIDYEINSMIKKHISDLKEWIKNKVSIIYRKPLSLTPQIA